MKNIYIEHEASYKTIASDYVWCVTFLAKSGDNIIDVLKSIEMLEITEIISIKEIGDSNEKIK